MHWKLIAAVCWLLVLGFGWTMIKAGVIGDNRGKR